MVLISIVDYLIVRNKPADMGYPTVSEIDGIAYYPAQTAAQKTTFKENFVKLLKMKNYWLISLYAFVIYGTVMGFQGLWFIPYAQQIYGLPKQQAANMLMFWPIGMALGCFAAGYASDRILKSRRNTSFYGMLIYVATWIPIAFFTGSIPVQWFYPLLFVMGFFCGAYVPNYAHIADGQPTSFMATSNGMLNIWYFVGGALYQALMGVVLDYYGKVNGKFPVEAYQATFMFCAASLVVGAVAMYFTTDSKPIITKKAA